MNLLGVTVVESQDIVSDFLCYIFSRKSGLVGDTASQWQYLQ